MQFTLNIQQFSSSDELSADDQFLLDRARKATSLSYAPYSQFYVGSSALLSNGEIICGGNQENASYGVCVCSERVLLAGLSTMYPKETIMTLAVSYSNPDGSSDTPISPCGMCRQSLLEHEVNAGHPVRIIMSGQSGEVWVVDSVKSILPLAFTSKDME